MSGVNAHDGDVWGAHSRRGGELSSPGSGARPHAARARRRPGPPPTHGDDPAPRQRPASCQASRGWTLQAGLEPASAAGRAWSGPVWVGRGPRSSRGRGWMESHEAVRSGEGRKGAAVSGPRRQGAQALVQTGRRRGGRSPGGSRSPPRSPPRRAERPGHTPVSAKPRAPSAASANGLSLPESAEPARSSRWS